MIYMNYTAFLCIPPANETPVDLDSLWTRIKGKKTATVLCYAHKRDYISKSFASTINFFTLMVSSESGIKI